MNARTLFACVLFTLAVCSTAQQCLDESGKPVDWWVIIKGPKSNAVSDPRVAAGKSYMYVDVNTVSSQTFTVSSKLLDDKNSALAYTLNQIYGNPGKYAHVMWNDEPPEGQTSSSKAHSKGVLGFGSKQGFYLIHSMPKFPEAASKNQQFSIPDTAIIYGQSYLCLSLGISEINTVGAQLFLDHTDIYDSVVPAEIAKLVPNVMNMISGANFITTAASKLASLPTLNKLNTFTLFAKNHAWNQDLYGNLIAPTYKTALQVETWMRPHEPALLPPTYPYEVDNVVGMHMPAKGKDLNAFTWTETDDHSKIAMSRWASIPVVCVGDINKQKSQWKRGGGSACIQHINLHKAFSGIFGEPETPKSNPTGPQSKYPSKVAPEPTPSATTKVDAPRVGGRHDGAGGAVAPAAVIRNAGKDTTVTISSVPTAQGAKKKSTPRKQQKVKNAHKQRNELLVWDAEHPIYTNPPAPKKKSQRSKFIHVEGEETLYNEPDMNAPIVLDGSLRPIKVSESPKFPYHQTLEHTDPMDHSSGSGDLTDENTVGWKPVRKMDKKHLFRGRQPSLKH